MEIRKLISVWSIECTEIDTDLQWIGNRHLNGEKTIFDESSTCIVSLK